MLDTDYKFIQYKPVPLGDIEFKVTDLEISCYNFG